MGSPRARAVSRQVNRAAKYRTASTTTTNTYTQRFLDLWGELHNPANGYFSPEGVPYHSRETLICEAPDYGHETTSEAYSYWAWLETMYGFVTGDWTFLSRMFDNMEAYIIPTSQDQPTTASAYNPASPAQYAPEFDLPSQYPTPLNSSVAVGQDPIAVELRTTYGSPEIYGMHWLLDVDNWYGYGRRGEGASRPSYINTFQRGPQESVWETVTHPSWENFRWGDGAMRGFLPLFILDSTYTPQWRYTNAPDADARLIQAMYWAKTFADAQGGNTTVDGLVAKAAKMGDYLRYALFDKYFKTMGCASPSCPAGTGYNAAHYLLSWYYGWGGPIDTSITASGLRWMSRWPTLNTGACFREFATESQRRREKAKKIKRNAFLSPSSLCLCVSVAKYCPQPPHTICLVMQVNPHLPFSRQCR